MAAVRFINGFGNNLFQYIAARLIAEQRRLPLRVITRPGYYGIDEFAKLGIELQLTNSARFDRVVGDEYSEALVFGAGVERRLLIRGYFEDYRHYLSHLD